MEVLISIQPSRQKIHTFTVIDYGFYEVEIVDANGCSTIKSLTMASPPNGLEINISTTAANCITGATATVTVISSIVVTIMNLQF